MTQSLLDKGDTEHISSLILEIRGQKIMLDVDLAVLYGVSTKQLNQQVKRNLQRFPETFRFKLTKQEKDELVTNCDRFEKLKHSTSLPSAFTEHGALMLASVLNSDIAVGMSIKIIETFVAMRTMLVTNQAFAQQLEALEKKVSIHEKHFETVFEAIKKLMLVDRKESKPVGFRLK